MMLAEDGSMVKSMCLRFGCKVPARSGVERSATMST
jgi:hypothetical protein